MKNIEIEVLQDIIIDNIKLKQQNKAKEKANGK